MGSHAVFVHTYYIWSACRDIYISIFSVKAVSVQQAWPGLLAPLCPPLPTHAMPALPVEAVNLHAVAKLRQGNANCVD